MADDVSTHISINGSDDYSRETRFPEGDGPPSNDTIPEEHSAPEAGNATGSNGPPANNNIPEKDAETDDDPAKYEASNKEESRDLLQDLIKAIEDGNTQTAENLLKDHSDLAKSTFTYDASREDDDAEERTTPLLLASELGRTDLVWLLVDRGANVNLTVGNAASYKGELGLLNALKSAILCNNRKDLERALEHSVDIINTNISFTSEDVTGHAMGKITPSMLAVALGRSEITKLLEANGADTEATAGNDESTSSLPAGYTGQLIATQLFRNKRATGSLLVSSHHTVAPLLAAAATGNEKVFEILLKHQADLTACDNAGNTALHLASKGGDTTNSTSIPKGGYLAIIEGLVKKQPALVNQPNSDEETALIVAAMKDQKSIVELLIKLKANIESRDRWQYTALLNAATYQANSVIPALLDAGADLTARTGGGLNALQLACENNDEDTVRLLLEVPPIKLDTLMEIDDTTQQTALGWAISNGMYDSIIFQLLESSFYFPRDPAQAEVHLSPQKEASDIIVPWLQAQETLDHNVPVFYWALLNAQRELCESIMAQNSGKPPELEDRCGATWLHVIALSGKVDALEWMDNLGYDWSADLLVKASHGFTPLHAAVKNGHGAMVQSFLQRIDEKDPTQMLDVILKEGKDAESAIAVAIVNNKPEIEEQLWNKLRILVEANKMQVEKTEGEDPKGENRKGERAPSETAERVVGAAAWRYATGEERYLKGFMKLFSPKDPKAAERDPLDFVVEHLFPTALWWLRSSGEYFGEIYFKKGDDLIARYSSRKNSPNQQVKDVDEIIEVLLTNPPPSRRPSDDKLSPQFEFDESIVQPKESYATVLDLTITDNTPIAIKPKRAQLQDLIYLRGPNKIMTDTGFRDLQAMHDKLFKRTTQQPKKPAAAQSSTPLQMKEPKKTTRKNPGSLNLEPIARKELRWFHIPTNNCFVSLRKPKTNWQQDLMVRVSRERKHSQSKHRRLAKLVKKSWLEIPAGGETQYMRPTCGLDKIEDLSMFALYFPYISWGAGPPKAQDRGKSEHDVEDHAKPDSISPANQKKDDWPKSEPDMRVIVHEALTLDQYYYDSIEDTITRDRDQALCRLFKTYKEKEAGKDTNPLDAHRPSQNPRTAVESLSINCKNAFETLFKKLRKLLHEQRPGTKESGHPHSRSTPQENETGSCQILKVNQLWLWILHDDTIITSVTKEIEGSDKTFLGRVLDRLNQTEFDRPRQSKAQSEKVPTYEAQIVQVILETARAMFNGRDILIDPRSGEKVAPLDVYRKAIQEMVWTQDDSRASFHANIFSIRSVTKRSSCFRTSKSPSSQIMADKSSPQMGPEPLQDQDTVHTSENPYEKIVEETDVLHTIKDILDELNIIKSLAQDQDNVAGHLQKIPAMGFSKPVLSDIKDEIQGMIQDAQNIQSDIKALLDLKQKKAGIVEAQATRGQNATVMSFTVVTIIFLPASFLTSLFALDISDFPHENGNLVYQGRWIFPIIFGVSLILSAFFVALAYNADWLKILIQQGMEHSRNTARQEDLRKMSQDPFDQGDPKERNDQESNEKIRPEPGTEGKEHDRTDFPRSPSTRWRTVQGIVPFMRYPKRRSDVEEQQNALRAPPPSSHEQATPKV
ncbi:hypothetical protein BP00DRAFT_473520 [Aspergillus indologenus CBS 114.80]|uniref:Ankyrin repeat protein n=1 Tax=Aspergillus indologenus CBS 114.80 TaxID=1450541 RepID=A0A2V5J441_9EURO|nr:hypothetical protein BP00DRAFT_473520 [Aspergillus indologenus CBS 114.80]